MQTAADAMTATGALSSDSKKIKDLKSDFSTQTNKTLLTSDFGVREPDHDNWLSASTADRQGPLLLEDNFAREKVCRVLP